MHKKKKHLDLSVDILHNKPTKLLLLDPFRQLRAMVWCPKKSICICASDSAGQFLSDSLWCTECTQTVMLSGAAGFSFSFLSRLLSSPPPPSPCLA